MNRDNRKTLLYSHPDCALHDMGAGHPEQPARMAAISTAIDDARLGEALDRREAPLAAQEDLVLAHPPGYVADLFAASPGEGRVQLDGDTAMNPHSLDAARRAAGAAIAAVDAVLAGEAPTAFCQTRPPGHHAERARSMGFCLFGNAAIAAFHALERRGLERVAILDFDVHHGNGTEDLVREEPRIFFASCFQHPHYPGYFGENIEGQRINTPLSAGSGSAELRQLVETQWLPALRAHQPQLILISAGFDGHRDDPLGGLRFEEADFHWVTARLVALADEICEGRVVGLLEGGYDLPALGRSAVAHLRALMGLPPA